MSKQLVLMQGPFNTRSGYGDHARSLFYALNDSKKYDIFWNCLSVKDSKNSTISSAVWSLVE